MKIYRTCERCSGKIWFWNKRVLNKHNECYYLDMLDAKDVELTTSDKRATHWMTLAESTDYISSDVIFNYANKHSEKNLKPTEMFMSQEVYATLNTDLTFIRDVMYSDKKVGKKKYTLTNFIGIDIIVDDTITGWYIQ